MGCARWYGGGCCVGGRLHSPDLWVCELVFGGWRGESKRLLGVLHFCVAWAVGAGVLYAPSVYNHVLSTNARSCQKGKKMKVGLLAC